MGIEREIEWVIAREGREEVGENGSGRQKDESGQERRKESSEDEEMREGEHKKEWEELSREGMIALMCLHEWQPCMNIACVIREQRRWGLNGLLTRPLNTGSTMERNRGEEAERRGEERRGEERRGEEREAPKYWQERTESEGGREREV